MPAGSGSSQGAFPLFPGIPEEAGGKVRICRICRRGWRDPLQVAWHRTVGMAFGARTLSYHGAVGSLSDRCSKMGILHAS
jgi:hypothetical protein